MSAWEQTPEYTELEEIFSEQTTNKIGLTAEQLNIVLHNIRYLKNHLGERGISITGIEKTGTEGLVDTYTITFSEGDPFVFTITNGDTPDVSGKEDKSNKVPEITTANKTSNDKYPSCSALVGYVDAKFGEMATLLSEV